MAISEEMYKYLKNYNEWIENGAVNDAPYRRSYGLCISLRTYTSSYATLFKLRDELKTLFNEEGFDSFYPFGVENYNIRLYNHTQHEDPLRLMWITEHIAEFEKINTI